jgi:hypothetical protein
MGPAPGEIGIRQIQCLVQYRGVVFDTVIYGVFRVSQDTIIISFSIAGLSSPTRIQAPGISPALCTARRFTPIFKQLNRSPV